MIKKTNSDTKQERNVRPIFYGPFYALSFFTSGVVCVFCSAGEFFVLFIWCSGGDGIVCL